MGFLLYSFTHLLTYSLTNLYYDPIKKTLGQVFNRTPWLRRCSWEVRQNHCWAGALGITKSFRSSAKAEWAKFTRRATRISTAR